MTLTWTLNTCSGRRDVSTRAEADQAIRSAALEAFGAAYGVGQANAVRSLCAQLRGAELPLVYQLPGFGTVTLEA